MHNYHINVFVISILLFDVFVINLLNFCVVAMGGNVISVRHTATS